MWSFGTRLIMGRAWTGTVFQYNKSDSNDAFWAEWNYSNGSVFHVSGISELRGATKDAEEAKRSLYYFTIIQLLTSHMLLHFYNIFMKNKTCEIIA